MNVDDGAKRQHFLAEIEQSIKIANREVIHQKIPPVSKKNMLSFAVSVARLRAQYLEAAFIFSDKVQGDGIEDGDVTVLTNHRERYEQTRAAFEALTQAIDRGYVDIAE